MACAYLREDRLGGDSLAGIDLHGVIGRNNVVFQPPLDRGVAFLKGAQAGSHDLRRRGISTGVDLGIDLRRLFVREAERALGHFSHEVFQYEGIIPLWRGGGCNCLGRQSLFKDRREERR